MKNCRPDLPTPDRLAQLNSIVIAQMLIDSGMSAVNRLGKQNTTKGIES